ncbi:hypothetical protein NFHSH190041_29130 [Shewanella sp. NFH-SH190041]|uniref:DUF3016 domain-containing protein n=1 Tax=Shewanella sp. NFH-SH190041 TaxID=2950245 RepID=UPI0021C33A0D|nr:DUF3016 domain-containing protein [Shewanella sp. NFH-SH190041]BDM65461.1 hypothetical protein NFHSH190041_29130 [Shewanella sp. NFH-SH190041]
MNYRLPLLGTLVAATLTGCATTNKQPVVEKVLTHDGDVNIIWQNPAKFSDIRSTTFLQSKFQNYLFTELTDALGHVADHHFGKNMQLDLQVTNLDLAGDVQPTFGGTAEDIRVVSQLYPPKISFDYVLRRDGKVVKSGSEKLNDMNFLFGIQPITSDPFPYEREMLQNWFLQTIKPALK